MSFHRSLIALTGALAISATLPACGIDDTIDDIQKSVKDGPVVVPKKYEFISQYGTESSVSYSGQIARHVLLHDLVDRVEGLTERIDQATVSVATGTVVAELNYYYAFDSATSGGANHGFSTTPAAKQTTYNDISEGKDLKGKVGKTLIGWDPAEATTPDALITALFQMAEDRAIEHAQGRDPLDPNGNVILNAAVTADGIHLVELIEKFLLGAVAYNQVTNEYLGDGADEGLLSDNTKAEEGEKFTAAEHHWDEAFGYFGAARDYADYTDEELAGASGRDDYKVGYHDTNSDKKIDLKSELNYSMAKYAAKRDVGSASTSKTNFTKDIFTAFLTGRATITAAKGTLSVKQLTDLKAQRDIIVKSWEKLIAANAIHYINDVIENYDDLGTADGYLELTEHWSELKGFALALQFSSQKVITSAQLTDLHAKIGYRPVLVTADVAAYKAKLVSARELLQTVYGFDAATAGAW